MPTRENFEYLLGEAGLVKRPGRGIRDEQRALARHFHGNSLHDPKTGDRREPSQEEVENIRKVIGTSAANVIIGRHRFPHNINDVPPTQKK